MADATVAKLNERFGGGGAALEPDVVAQLQSILRMHGLSVQELFYKWEAYCIKMDLQDATGAAALAMDRLRAFKQDLQDALERQQKQQQQAAAAAASLPEHAAKKAKAGATPRHAKKGVYGILDGLVPSTPGTARRSGSRLETPSVTRVRGAAAAAAAAGRSPDPTTPTKETPASSFAERTNAGEVVEVLNPQLAAGTAAAPQATPRVKLTAASDQKKLRYKPLAMKLSEASEILDDRIDEFVTLVMDHHGIEYEAFGSAASQGTSEVVAVGRIASDAAEGKLNAASVVLETSRRMGGGLRVPLDLGRLAGYQFFPGQIVALRGTNATGAAFVVSQVLPLPLLPSAASTPAALAAHRAKMAGEGLMDVDSGGAASDADDPPPLTIFFAAGPYTADDNLEFAPLQALVREASAAGADAVVLGGPFLDVDHPLLATGDFDLPAGGAAGAAEGTTAADADPDTATMATVFRHTVGAALQRLAAAHPGVTVVLVPSVRDVLDKHVSWPQDALRPRRPLGLPEAARLVGNPMTLSLNEMVVGVSTQDVLYELRHEELAGGRVRAGDETANPVARACRYLLEQRHYFPLFPAVDRRRLPRTGVADTGGVATGAMLDPSYLKLGEMVNVRPDVLVLPSALPPFAKVVESVVVVNPGALSKRRGAGTYARMTLHAPAAPAAEGADTQTMVGHRIFERARVEIVRI